MVRDPLPVAERGDAGIGVTPEEVASLDLFAQLPVDELRSIAPHFRHRVLTTGQHVIEHHDRSFDLFFVRAGRLRVVLYSPAGRDVSLRDLLPGAVFGELAAIDGGLRSATVIANQATRLAVLSGADFLALTRAHPAVTEVLLGYTAPHAFAWVFIPSSSTAFSRIRLANVRVPECMVRNGSTTNTDRSEVRLIFSGDERDLEIIPVTGAHQVRRERRRAKRPPESSPAGDPFPARQTRASRAVRYAANGSSTLGQ